MVVEQVDGSAGDPPNAPEGHAPPLDDRPSDPARRPPATSRPLWLTTYVLVVLLIAMRIPQAYAYLQGRVPPEMSAKIHDADMERLALKSGVFVAFVLTALAVAIFFSLAALLERRLFTVGKAVGGRVSFGLFFLVAALCTVPVQLSAVVFDIPNPRASLLYYGYIASVGLLAPFVFRAVWWRLPKVKVGILFTSTVVLSLLTSVG